MTKISFFLIAVLVMTICSFICTIICTLYFNVRNFIVIRTKIHKKSHKLFFFSDIKHYLCRKISKMIY